MLRITDSIKRIPVDSIIICASCEKAVYVVTGNDLMENGKWGLAITSLKKGRPINSSYHLIWCTLCKCEVQLNLRVLYIHPIPLIDLLDDRITLGRRIMAFDSGGEVE